MQIALTGLDTGGGCGVRRPVLIGCLVGVYLLLDCVTGVIEIPPIKLLILMPMNDTKPAINYTAPAIIVAIDRIRKEQILPSNPNISWVLLETLRSPKLTAINFQSEYVDDNVTAYVIIGGFYPDVCKILESISDALNISFVGVDCNVDTMMEMGHKRASTFVTMSYYRPSLAPLFNFIMDRFNWKRVVVLATSDEQSTYYGRTIKDSIDENNKTAFLLLCTFNDTEDDDTFTKDVKTTLEEMKKQATVFIFAMEAHFAARILLVAKREGMYNGEYAFVGNWLEWIKATLSGDDITDWDLTMEGLITLEPSYGQRDTTFRNLVNDAPRTEPHIINLSIMYLTETDRRWENFAKDVYSAVLLYAYAVKKAAAKGGADPPKTAYLNGSFVMAEAKGLSYTANPELVYFDGNIVRRTNWSIKNLLKNGQSVVLAEFDKDMNILSEGDTSQVTWPGGDHKVPKDSPKCGWKGEKCKGDMTLPFTIIYSVSGCLAFVCVILALFLWRQMKIRMEKRTLEEWRVNWSRVTVIGDHIIGRLSVQETYRSRIASEVFSRVDISEIRSAKDSHNRHRLYTLAGFYKGKTVAIKNIQRESVDVYQSTIYNELKQLFYINHENVNPFIGVCSEAPNVCVLMLYADRGSLQDVLAETKYDINWEFRACLAMDIVKGMEYLHESPIGTHGHLTSSNCVVDNTWQCRITDYGLKHFKQPKTHEIGIFRSNSDMLWTAPEILRKPETDRDRIYGTKEGDVYSFGIIVSEIITKELPYHTQLEPMSSEGVIRSIIEGTGLRPVLPTTTDDPIAPKWNALAVVCWHEIPEVRLTFKTVRGRLKQIVGGKVPNLMHRMQTLLHDGLAKKQTEIERERKKSKTIFYNLLPKSVADDIIAGNEVRPKRIDSVTICLCETTGILEAQSLTPVQMTEMLTSLYRVYDVVVKKYRVTQLSSIGTSDLMLLGSGLPQATDRHAQDICEMSLDLIRVAEAFTTPYAPNLSASLKISVHTGDVIAAVIGDVVTRYNVIGEAAQTLTDMHSTRKNDLGIRISETTYDLVSKNSNYVFEHGENHTLKFPFFLKTFWLSRKSEPRKSEPQKSEPRKSELRKSEPRKSELRKSEPRKSEPRKSEPRKTEPRKSEPRKSEPRKTESQKSEPRKSEPRKTESRKSEPRKSRSSTLKKKRSSSPVETRKSASEAAPLAVVVPADGTKHASP